jgi:hypothetical protein
MLKSAKSKAAPHKILLAEYRGVHFWDGSADGSFAAPFPPLLPPLLS